MGWGEGGNLGCGREVRGALRWVGEEFGVFRCLAGAMSEVARWVFRDWASKDLCLLICVDMLIYG